MRVLHVIHSLDPRSGGPPEALRQLVRHQVAAGLRPMIATTDIQAMKPWMDQERFRSLIMRRYPLPKKDLLVYKAWGRTGVLQRYGFVPLLSCRLEDLMKADNTRPDIVHVHGLFSHLTEATCRVARCLGIPYILRPAGGLNAYSLQVGSLFLKKLMIRISTRKNLMGAFAVQATAESEAQWIAGSFPGANVVTIPHGVSVPTPHYLEESRSRFLARFPELVAAKVVLYMGRFTEKKRPDLVLDAFIRSKLPSQGWKLVMAGDGPMREDLKRNAKGNSKVLFTGFLAGRLKWGAMGAATVFALPSKDENFGVGVAEAMGAAVPVLLGRGNQFARVVEEHRLGRVVGDTVEDWIAMLDSLEEGLPGDMGENGRKYAREHLSWGPVSTRLRVIYREAAGGVH